MPPAVVRGPISALPREASTDRANVRPWRLWVYLGLVIAGGAALLTRFSPADVTDPSLGLALLGASLALSTFKLRLPLGRNVSTMSMACAADLVGLMMLGADVAMVTASAGVVAQCTIRVRRSQPLYRSVFSVATVVMTVQAAGLVWRYVGGDLETPGALFGPLLATIIVYFLVNTALVATAIGLSSGLSPVRAWHREFLWSAPSYFVAGVAAGIVALILAQGQHILLPLALVPIYVSYRAYQMSLRRIDEERRHAEELSQMVATTQEALERATQSEAALAAEKDRLVLESSRLAVTVQTIGDGVMMVDRGGSVLLMNDEARRLVSLASVQPGERPMAKVLLALGLSHGTVVDALHRLWDRGETVRLVNDVAPNGRIPCVQVTATPTRDADGRAAGAVWVLRDVTDIARAEQERAKAAHLESIGVLAGGLAHDFNNILMGVVGNLSLAQDLVGAEQDALRARLRHAATACTRARGVTSQLLTFAKGGAPVKTTASMRELLVDCTRFVLSGSPVAARFDIDPDLWPADIDVNQVAQVVHNLVLNAMQAMPRGGTINLSLRNVELAPDAIPAESGLTAGHYVRLVVRDRGPGIAPEHLGRIFDPYFTTKDKGSGLGLAISYSIMRAHGGAITVASQNGEGAAFTVYVPALPGSVMPPASATPSSTRPVGRTVLLMEDDDMVAEVAQEMLESLGLAAVVTPNGEQAVERYRTAVHEGTPFDLVILDLTVPGGMGGAEAAAGIRAIHPDATIFVTSGYADGDVLARHRDYGFDGVLPKPFTLPDLRRALGVP
jgi:PAS domain S-box-containing protein